MQGLVDLAGAPDALVAAALGLGAAHEAETGPLDRDRLAAMAAEALMAVALPGPGGVDALLIGFGPGARYDSPNYAWVSARFDDAAYVDRVIVAPRARGRGLARALYHAFAERAAARGLRRIACEVNIEPPNPASDAFHAALGFAECGRAPLPGGKTVRYLVRPLPLD
jgi:uncharacterized protein